MSHASVAAILALGVLTACSEQRGTAIKAGVMTQADSADQIFFDVQAPMESGGVKRGTLYADTMYVLNESTRFDFTVGHADFNTETGVPNGTMKADRGRYDQRTQILEGWGHVVVKTVDGKSLKSPHVIYNQLRDEITSDTTFEVVDAGRVTTGIGFHTDHKLIKKVCDRSCNVTGKVTIPK
jgi:LPS export ABC transporter protein LptC